MPSQLTSSGSVIARITRRRGPSNVRTITISFGAAVFTVTGPFEIALFVASAAVLLATRVGSTWLLVGAAALGAGRALLGL